MKYLLVKVVVKFQELQHSGRVDRVIRSTALCRTVAQRSASSALQVEWFKLEVRIQNGLVFQILAVQYSEGGGVSCFNGFVGLPFTWMLVFSVASDQYISCCQHTIIHQLGFVWDRNGRAASFAILVDAGDAGV